MVEQPRHTEKRMKEAQEEADRTIAKLKEQVIVKLEIYFPWRGGGVEGLGEN